MTTANMEVPQHCVDLTHVVLYKGIDCQYHRLHKEPASLAYCVALQFSCQSGQSLHQRDTFSKSQAAWLTSRCTRQ